MTDAAQTSLPNARPTSRDRGKAGGVSTALRKNAPGQRGFSAVPEKAASKARRQPSHSVLSLLASDLMSSPAIAVRATETVSSVARLMLESGVRGVPVLGAGERPVGMASDGDLLRTRGEDRRDWWLEMLAKQSPPDGLFNNALERPVAEVMSAPVITISAKASVRDIAEAFHAHRIKRLPVVADDRLVGIVTRADLVFIADSLPSAPAARSGEGGPFLGFLESLIGGASLRGVVERAPDPAPAPQQAPQEEKDAAPNDLSADAFRSAVRAFKAVAQDNRQASKREAELERQREVKALLDQRVSSELWSKTLDQAKLAAESGEQEFMMLRFPSDLCSDGGRKINVAEEGWEGTLRGAAAELYSRWRTELKPRGFGLSARIVTYNDGIVGDIGLFLTWKGD